MKKILFLFLLFVVVGFFAASCSNNISFADLKKAEKAAITKFLIDQDIKVITMEEFLAKDSTTDVSKNEYVLFNDNGVYMQIVRKGEGNRIADGTTRKVLSRFVEVNLQSCDTTAANIYSSSIVEVMMIKNESGTYSGTFTSGYMMNPNSQNYSTAVPTGWLVPLPYIRLSRNTSNIAKVRLIVPYGSGTAAAQQGVTPYWYELTYQAGI